MIDLEKELNINEIFGPVIQGEGPHSGKKAFFVRTFGCIPPFCSFCDSKYSWNNPHKESHKKSITNILEELKVLGAKKKDLIVITGGEPFAQENVYALAGRLGIDYKIQFETSGKSEIEKWKLPFYSEIVMSPKKYNNKFNIHDDITLRTADYYKFVVEQESDIKEINDLVTQYSLDKEKVFLMPMGADLGDQLRNMEMVSDLCVKNDYRFSPRIHTLTYGNKRGV